MTSRRVRTAWRGGGPRTNTSAPLGGPGVSRSILVTGASTGIGRASALRLAKAGHTVFAGVRREADARSLRAAAANIAPVMLDVTDAHQVSATAELVSRATGKRLDGLVNNAGIGVSGPIECVPVDMLRQQFEVNVFGQVAVTQAVLPLLRAAQGRIVNIGSIGDRITIPFGGPLCASKYAVLSLNDALRQELAPWRVDVILVEPASIRSHAAEKLEKDAENVLEIIGAQGRQLYGAAYASMVAASLRRERDGSDPDVVARVVQHALTVRKPRTRYLVGKDCRVLATAARMLPDRTLDALRLRILGIS
ncbi:MAG TPA: SDR family NAD(P)-dependent oxidoreductase [Micromonosporaceae bacterium]|nr:SDR family NAD(P)-dependent oxidoreductase [Micromonosporaceae bacterium]